MATEDFKHALLDAATAATEETSPPREDLSRVVVRPLADGLRICLPRRRMKNRWIVGLGWCLIPVTIMGLITGSAVSDYRRGETLMAVFLAVTGLPFMVICPGLLIVGLWILFGRSEISLTRGKLYATERAVLLRWSWARPAAGVYRLQVVGDAVNSCVVAECRRGKRLWLAYLYPRATAELVMNTLAREMGLPTGLGGRGPHPGPRRD